MRVNVEENRYIGILLVTLPPSKLWVPIIYSVVTFLCVCGEDCFVRPAN
jgi:hypothetical protein